MPTVNFVMGKDAGFYFSATPVTATPTDTQVTAATLVDNLKDVNISLSVETEDITTRGSGGWANDAPTVKTASISGTMQYKPGDAFLTAVKNAFLAGSELFASALSQKRDVAGAEGLTSNFIVSKFDPKQPIKGAQTVDYELKPSSYTVWYVKSGS